jgi:phosphate transport system protein
MEFNHDSYSKQLSRIPSAICEMARLVQELLTLAGEAIRSNSDFFAKASSIDEQVNALDREIERLATTVLTFQKPMAKDLRMVTCSLKICSYLESTGDLAKKIVKRAAKSNVQLSPEITREFSEVADTVIKMLEEATQALETQSALKAEESWKRDDKVDALYRKLYEDIQNRMQEDPENIPAYIRILFAAKGFERIGDYVTRFATNIYYIVTGERFNKEAYESKKVANN